MEIDDSKIGHYIKLETYIKHYEFRDKSSTSW